MAQKTGIHALTAYLPLQDVSKLDKLCISESAVMPKLSNVSTFVHDEDMVTFAQSLLIYDHVKKCHYHGVHLLTCKYILYIVFLYPPLLSNSNIHVRTLHGIFVFDEIFGGVPCSDIYIFM